MPQGGPIADLVELFERSAELHAAREMVGVRRDGRWTYATYGEVKKQVDEFRAGLASLGISRGDRVAIIANNRVQWAVAAYACFGLGASLVPMYESQTEKEWAFIVRDSGAKVLIAATAEILDKTKDLPGQLGALGHVVSLDDVAAALTYAEIRKRGAKRPVVAVRPGAEAEAFLIYTSGTTGTPKGVVLSHGNVTSNVVSISACFDIRETDRSLAFLPWAHCFGCTCELQVLVHHGASLALCSSVDRIVDDLGEVRPTILIAVPRIFNRVYARVQEQLGQRPAAVQAVLRLGLRAAMKRRQGERLGAVEKAAFAVADRLVFSKVRGRLGGRLRYAISGAAALATEVAEFVHAIGVDVYEGYGLTEASPIVSANTPAARRVGSVGRPIEGVRVAIDRSHSEDPKLGEIVVHGPNVTRGYHDRPAESAVLFTPDGGLRTGDLGYLDADGFLFVAGRIKEQYKLENGKYVIPSPLEEKLKLSALIANVMIHGANRPFNVALVVANPAGVARWAEAEGIGPAPLGTLLRDERLVARMGREIDRYCADVKGYERIERFALIDEDFTQQNGMLTPSLKLRRSAVLERWAAEIERLYASKYQADRG
jgi:long-chain acyl-CoA synthetase